MLKQLFLSTFRYHPGTLKLLKITVHKLTVAITATSLNTRGTEPNDRLNFPSRSCIHSESWIALLLHYNPIRQDRTNVLMCSVIMLKNNYTFLE